MPIYMLNIDGVKVPLATDDQGRIFIAPSGPITIGGQPFARVLAFNGATWESAGMDSATRALESITYPHHEIHDGHSFECCYDQMVSDINDRSIITFRTPDTTTWLHVVAAASASALSEFITLEAPTITDNAGAMLPVYNRNRNSVNTSGVFDTSQNPDVQGQATFFTEATMGNVTVGTEIAHETIGGASGPPARASAGASRSITEFMLKPNTLYAFLVNSLTADDNYHQLCLSWYEHANK